MNNTNKKIRHFCIVGGKTGISFLQKTNFDSAGKYGSSMAYCLQEHPFNKVKFLVRRQEQADEINEKRTNAKVSDLIKFKSCVKATTDHEEALKNAHFVLLCIPAQTIPDFLEQNFELGNEGSVFVNCSKGKVFETVLCYFSLFCGSLVV